MFKSYGYLKYDPVSSRSTFKDWWLILLCDPELVNYYRYWMSKESKHVIKSVDWLRTAGIKINNSKQWPIIQYGVKVKKSVWGPHISIVRGETPKNIEFWGKYENRKIHFQYNPEYLNTNGKHCWIRIVSKDLEDIRQELGLTPQPMYLSTDGRMEVNPFHLTIGYLLD